VGANLDDSDAEAHGQDCDDDSAEADFNDGDDYDDDEEMAQEAARTTSTKKKPKKTLSEAAIKAANKKANKTGVVYISRVPPFMTPQTLKRLLGQHGEIGRIFLTPESAESVTRRKKMSGANGVSKGTSRKSYTDGWIEFLDKKQARLVVETLNTRNIGGKKSGFYYDDVWNLRYLTGFKWYHLTEQIANETAERAARMRAEIQQATRENKLFLKGIEMAKKERGMEEKRRAKELAVAAVGGEGANHETSAPKPKRAKYIQDFKQNKVHSRSANPTSAGASSSAAASWTTGSMGSSDVGRVLTKIF